MSKMDIFSLALFPLNTVLYPGGLLPLHIFEPRYRTMIKTCLEEKRPFGVVMIRQGQEVGQTADPHQIGTMARIVQVQHLEDGRMYLLAVGEDRFRLWEYALSADDYLLGQVSRLDEDEGDLWALAPLVETVHEKIDTYLDLYTTLEEEEAVELTGELASEPGRLAYQIASLLNISTMEKQALLEIDDPEERLRREVTILDREIAYLQQLKETPNAPNTFKLPWGDELNLN